MAKESVLSVVQELRDLFKSAIAKNVFSVSPVKTVCSKDNRFTRYSDGTVKDSQLNLIWYPILHKFTWEEAKKECEKLGCRLPTTRELFSITDLTKYPAVDKEIFPDTKTDDYYWTGDTCPWNADYARVVYFYSGYVSHCNKDDCNYVRPVRSSQC